MKILTGELDPQKGTVVRPRKLGVLRQDQFAFDAYRVIDTVIMGNKPLWTALEERDRIYAKPEMTNEDGMRLGELEGTIGDEDGYTAESDAAVLLDGLDISEALHERKMSELQGGQKVRVLLAQALFGKPEALLLDEPTNYLDLDSIHWLQDT
jgi:ATPase subunit of ABC transporter with duplicated ATPase domains